VSASPIAHVDEDDEDDEDEFTPSTAALIIGGLFILYLMGRGVLQLPGPDPQALLDAARGPEGET
jgi:hypothetical protein